MDEQPPQKRVKLRNEPLDAQDSGKYLNSLVQVMRERKKNLRNLPNLKEQVAKKTKY